MKYGYVFETLSNQKKFLWCSFLKFFNFQQKVFKFSTTFQFLSNFHDFPGEFIFPGFSMTFHDRENLDILFIDFLC